MMLTSISSAGVSFLFWVLAARLYSVEEIGVATAMISAVTLLVVLSRLGFDQSLIRYLPEKGPSRVVGTCLIVTTLLSLLLAVLFVLSAGSLSRELRLGEEDAVIFISCLLLASITHILGTHFLAFKKAELYFCQSLVLDSRILFLIPLVQFGAMGVFSSVGVSFMLAATFSFFVILRNNVRLTDMNWQFVRESIRYSIGNYAIGLLMASPIYVLPLMILSQLGPTDAASYYIAFAVASLLFIVPTAFSTSLFIEGSHGATLKTSTLKTVKTMFILLLPLVFVLCVFGRDLLLLIGREYGEAFGLLQLMAISSLFFSILSIFFSVKRVQKDIGILIFLSLISFSLMIGLSFLLIPRFGVVGVGYSWLVSYGTCAGFIGLAVVVEGWA